MTSLKQISLFTEDKSTSSPEDSHVNRIAWPENVKGKKMNAISGQKCLEQLEKFNHVGLWAKTFSALLIGRTDWYSTKCKLTWKLRGTKFNRMYFQLYPSTLRTEEIEFGLLPTATAQDFKRRGPNSKQQGLSNTENWAQLLPTPTAMDSTGATANMKSTQVKEGSMHSVTLSRAMNMGLLPTPQAMDCMNNPPRQITPSGRIVSNQGHNGSAPLKDLAMNGMLPTPTATDYKGAHSPDAMVSKDGIDRSSLLRNIYVHTEKKEWKSQDGTTSQLNPLFVMEMMGFPPNWTELPFQNGDKSPSKPREMP